MINIRQIAKFVVGLGEKASAPLFWGEGGLESWPSDDLPSRAAGRRRRRRRRGCLPACHTHSSRNPGVQVAPTDIEEGMRVGVDRQKYQIQIPLPAKIDPSVRPCRGAAGGPGRTTPARHRTWGRCRQLRPPAAARRCSSAPADAGRKRAPAARRPPAPVPGHHDDCGGEARCDVQRHWG